MCAFLILRDLLHLIELIVKTNNHTHQDGFHGNRKKQNVWSVGSTFSLRSKTDSGSCILPELHYLCQFKAHSPYLLVYFLLVVLLAKP